MRIQRRWAYAAPVAIICLCALSLSLWAQNTGKLKTEVNPGRAGVFLDGKFLGPAANFKMGRTYTVPAGDHELKLVEPRYKDFTTKVTVQAGKTTVFKQNMEPLPAPKPPFGKLRVIQGSSGKFGAVYLNDHYMGHIDEFSNFAQGLLISPGEYQLRIASVDGGQDHVEKITIKENQTTVVKAGSK